MQMLPFISCNNGSQNNDDINEEKWKKVEVNMESGGPILHGYNKVQVEAAAEGAEA